MSSVLRRIGALVLQSAVIVIVTMLMIEALVALSFRYPDKSPIPPSVLRQMHVLFDRNTIQVMPECAVYDAEVTYTLRPGSCRFANREFDNAYSINSKGLRDNEASLRAPSVVVLGDSLAMGWGVEQNESFPEVFEQRTGRLTLNAGVSSYGTVRELLLLKRLDLSSVTDVVVQYTGNDLLENEQLMRGEFTILTRDAYESTVRANADMLSYHIGKHTINLLVMLRNLASESKSLAREATSKREATVFLSVIARPPVDLSGYTVTVVSLDGDFVAHARRLAAASSNPVARRLRFVDASAVAKVKGAFYLLDDHPTAKGQALIATALVEALAGTH